MGKLGWDGDGLVEFVGVDVRERVCLGRGCGLRIQRACARRLYIFGETLMFGKERNDIQD